MGNSPPDAVARMLLRELIQVETLRRERIIRASNHAGE
jgi:hypothetical protein